MSTATMPVPMPATRPMPLDDELVALTLQLEELGLVSQSAKGKHPVDQPPDFEVAFTSFRADLDEYKTFLEDQKLAQSIGAAVHTDGPLIGAFAAEEAQSLQDRRFVLDLSNNDPETEAPPRSLMLEAPGAIDDWMSTISETIAAQSIVDFSDDETEAGPSTSFVEGQFGTMKAFSTKVQCVACADDFSRAKIVTTGCGHRYCAKCITKLFMRAAKEEQYYPPRCCKQPISLASVSKHMNAVDLETFRLASIQYTTLEKVWCSNRFCRIFIVPSDRNTALQLATCPRCATRTCTMCSNGYHPGTDCPDDPAIRQTRDLAQTLGWQTCRACHRVVDLRSGCNHITCVCKAEFCYVCGVNWKNCNCAPADIDRIEERAQEIVDRDAPANMLPDQRRARVNQVFADLQDNHECEHSRRFQRVFADGSRRGFECEMCEARHYKYILQCRRCYMNVCEDCRRNRI